MKKIILVLFIIFTACFGRGNYIPEPVRATDKGAKLVSEIWRNPNPSSWRSSRWYRLHDDITTPTRVVISDDNFACIMGNELHEPRSREYYVCLTGWRFPRNF